MVSCGEVHACAAELRSKGMQGDDFLREIVRFCHEVGATPEEVETIQEVYSLQIEFRRSRERFETALDVLLQQEQALDSDPCSVLVRTENGWMPIGGLRLA